MLAVLGPRRACLAREITKVHEEWKRGTIAEILESMASRERILGEITIVVDRGTESAVPRPRPDSIQEHIKQVISADGGMSSKEALKEVARQQRHYPTRRIPAVARREDTLPALIRSGCHTLAVEFARLKPGSSPFVENLTAFPSQLLHL